MRLAPFYVIGSALPYPDFYEPKIKLAMKVGGKYPAPRINADDWIDAASALRVDADQLLAQVQSMCEVAPDAFATVRADPEHHRTRQPAAVHPPGSSGCQSQVLCRPTQEVGRRTGTWVKPQARSAPPTRSRDFAPSSRQSRLRTQDFIAYSASPAAPSYWMIHRRTPCSSATKDPPTRTHPRSARSRSIARPSPGQMTSTRFAGRAVPIWPVVSVGGHPLPDCLLPLRSQKRESTGDPWQGTTAEMAGVSDLATAAMQQSAVSEAVDPG